MRNLVIAIVYTIYVLIMTPIERTINRRIARRWLAYLAQFWHRYDYTGSPVSDSWRHRVSHMGLDYPCFMVRYNVNSTTDTMCQ